jgi:predicted CXXCH cytochrome family protein
MLYHHPGKWACGDCHKVHGSDIPMMFKKGPLELCAECHKRHEQFTHPIGEKALDPRNLEAMSCITCHDPCTGTMFKFNLRGSAERGLCIQCHPKH